MSLFPIWISVYVKIALKQFSFVDKKVKWLSESLKSVGAKSWQEKKAKWKTENVKLSFIGRCCKSITKDNALKYFQFLDAGFEEDP